MKKMKKKRILLIGEMWINLNRLSIKKDPYVWVCREATPLDRKTFLNLAEMSSIRLSIPVHPLCTTGTSYPDHQKFIP